MGFVTTVMRPMTTDDLDEVACLEQEHQPRPWSKRLFQDEMAQGNRLYVVAGSPVEAFGGVMIIGDEAHVTNLLVVPEHRRRGLGRLVMGSLIEAAIGAGAKHLTLEVRASTEAARALYASMGLVPVGFRSKYYGDDDALIMWAHDIDRPAFLESLR